MTYNKKTALTSSSFKKIKLIYESVDLIGFSFEIKAYEKIYRRHIADIPRINFFV